MAYIEIHWTAPSINEARKVARLLVQEKMVACAHIIPWVESVFLWKDILETTQEVKIIFKTVKNRFEDVKRVILEHTSYEVPEILEVPITDGHTKYLEWVTESVTESVVSH